MTDDPPRPTDHSPAAAPLQHGAMALLPSAQALISARADFDAKDASDDQRARAARVMVEHGAPFDRGRARTWLRSRGTGA